MILTEPVAGSAAQACGDAPAVQPRHPRVEDGHIGPAAAGVLQPGGPIGGEMGREPGHPQVDRDELADDLVVIDDEDARRAGPERRPPSRPSR